MKRNILVREAGLDDIAEVHKNIIEFDDNDPPKSFFLNRIEMVEHIIIVAYCDSYPIGYIIAYKDNMNEQALYCWLAGVDYHYRRNGALSKMMDYLRQWAISKNYEKITIKSRNRYKGMLIYLIKNGWNLVHIEKKGAIDEYRIYLELSLI